MLLLSRSRCFPAIRVQSRPIRVLRSLTEQPSDSTDSFVWGNPAAPEKVSLAVVTVKRKMTEYRNQVERLSDLTMTTNTVERVTFDNCQIVGPAVVFMDGCTLTGSSVQGTFDEVIWEIADERQSIVAPSLSDRARSSIAP